MGEHATGFATGGKRPGSGRKKFEPTKEQRAIVSALAGFGIPHKEICVGVINPTTGKPVDKRTFRTVFDTELAQARMKVRGMVAAALLKALKYPKNQSVAIFLGKAVLGLREGATLEEDRNQSGGDVFNIFMTMPGAAKVGEDRSYRDAPTIEHQPEAAGGS